MKAKFPLLNLWRWDEHQVNL